MADAPGMAFDQLVKQAPVEELKMLLGVSVINELKKADVDVSKSETVGRFACSISSPVEMLSDKTSRDLVLSWLSPPKRKELILRLDGEANEYSAKRLRVLTENPAKLPAILSFFGECEQKDHKYSSSSVTSIEPTYGLHAYQSSVVTRVESRLEDIPKKVLVHMPTGSGKTRTAMHIVANHLRKHTDTTVFWLAQSSELLEQAANEFERAWGALGHRRVSMVRFWGSGESTLQASINGIVLASLRKMSNYSDRNPQAMLLLADRASLTVIDEAHQAVAPTYQRILTSLHRKRAGNCLLGLTATPGRSWSDMSRDQELVDYFDGNKITIEVDGFSSPIAFLVSEGYLSRPHFKQCDLPPTRDQATRQQIVQVAEGSDFNESLLHSLGDDMERNMFVVRSVEDLTMRHERIIAFCPSVRSARVVTAVLTAKGVEAHAVTAETAWAERETAVARYKGTAPKPIVLCNFGVFTTGFDAPKTSAVLIARPTMSLVLYSQMVGRAVRGPKAGGRDSSEILTVMDPDLPGFGNIADAFLNWEDVWNEV